MKKSVTQNGMFYGAAMVAIYLLFFVVNKVLNFTIAASLLAPIVLGIIFLTRGIRQERDENEGMLTFGEAFSVAFPIFLIGTFMFSLTLFLHVSFDQEYKQFAEETVVDQAIKSSMRVAGFFDPDPEALERAEQEIRQNMKVKFNLVTIFVNFIGSLVFPGAIMALIISAIMKKT